MEKTLVIILAETRAWEKTFDNIKKNLITPLNADLCLCIGVKPDYKYENPFYRAAKYRFTYDEPEDWADAFNYAEFVENGASQKIKIIASADADSDNAAGEHTYINYKDTNAVWGKIRYWSESTDNIDFLGRYPSEQKVLEDENILAKNYEEIAYHTADYSDPTWRYCAYGIKKAEHQYASKNVQQYAINTLRPARAQQNSNAVSKWRRFLKIKNQFMGGIKDPEDEHPGSAGILIFFRWFLWKKLCESGAIENYDRFIITRSDYVWRLEHPRLELLQDDKIWVPNCETYDGITDRHTVIPRVHMEKYCGLLKAMLDDRSDEYFNKMMEISKRRYFNLEKFILFHLKECGIEYDFFPYVMFTIRPKNVNTRWSAGTAYCEKGEYYIKYISEDKCSQFYVNDYITWRRKNGFNGNLTDYYCEVIPCEVMYFY